MIISQTKRLTVNSISFDYSLWIKVGETFLNLFIGSNRMTVCSESSIVRSDVYHLVQDVPMLFRWSVAPLFRYAFVETFTAIYVNFLGVTS